MFEQHLLAIEDDAEVAELIRRVALEAGFNAHVAGHGLDIVGMYRLIKPSVILLDILMPDMDGFDVLNFLGEEKSQARIVILSGSPEYRLMAEKVAGARDLHIVANLAKPFRIASLRLALQEVRLEMQAHELEEKSA